MRARSAIIENRELLSVVRVTPMRHTLRILAIVERILAVCAVAEGFDRRSTAPAKGNERRHDQRLAKPVGDADGVGHDVGTVPLRLDSLRPADLDLAKALDSRGNHRRAIR